RRRESRRESFSRCCGQVPEHAQGIHQHFSARRCLSPQKYDWQISLFSCGLFSKQVVALYSAPSGITPQLFVLLIQNRNSKIAGSRPPAFCLLPTAYSLLPTAPLLSESPVPQNPAPSPRRFSQSGCS